MKKKYLLAYLMLAALIILNACLKGHLVTLLLLLLAGIKFHLIAAYYMNYRQAHPLWKLIISTICILILLLLYLTTKV